MKRKCWREETIFLIVEFLLIFTFTIIVEFCHFFVKKNILINDIYRKGLLLKSLFIEKAY